MTIMTDTILEEGIIDTGTITAIAIGIIDVIRTTPTTVVYINPQSTLLKGEMS
jgi:hypothetical protein